MLSGFIFVTQSAFAHSYETNIWGSRKKNLEERRKSTSQTTMLAMLPSPVPTTSFPNVRPGESVLWRISIGNPSLDRNLLLDSRRSLPAVVGGNDDGLGRFASILSLYGTIRKITPSPTPSHKGRGKTIIHIQDIHQNAEAQENIAKAVQALIQENAIDALGLEGAFHPINIDVYRNFPFPDSVKAVADFLLRENLISGPIYGAITSKTSVPPIIGVDHKGHYEANVKALKTSAPLAEKSKAKLQKIEKRLNEQKQSVFNPSLLAFDRKIGAYRKGEMALVDYVKLISSPLVGEGREGGLITSSLKGKNSDTRFLRSGVLSPSPYLLPQGEGKFSPVLQVFLEALEMESSLNFRQIESERSRLIEALVQKLSKAQTLELMNQSLAYRTGALSHAGFYDYLRNLCESNGVPLRMYPNMGRYLHYVLLTDSLDVEKVIQEARELEERCYAALAKRPEERKLIAESREIYLVGKLLDFSLSKEEWEEYKGRRINYSPPLVGGGRGRGLITSSLNSENALDVSKDPRNIYLSPLPTLPHKGGGILHLEPFEKFYQEAEHRDRLMAENLIKHKAKGPAVLVTGGFHSQGITERLANAGMTVITFVPKITKVDETDASAYLSAFLKEKSPLETLFEGEKLFLAQFPNRLNSPTAAALMVGDAAHRNKTAVKSVAEQAFPQMATTVSGEITENHAVVRFNSIWELITSFGRDAYQTITILYEQGRIKQIVVTSLGLSATIGLVVVQMIQASSAIGYIVGSLLIVLLMESSWQTLKRLQNPKLRTSATTADIICTGLIILGLMLMSYMSANASIGVMTMSTGFFGLSASANPPSGPKSYQTWTRKLRVAIVAAPSLSGYGDKQLKGFEALKAQGQLPPGVQVKLFVPKPGEDRILFLQRIQQFDPGNPESPDIVINHIHIEKDEMVVTKGEAASDLHLEFDKSVHVTVIHRPTEVGTYYPTEAKVEKTFSPKATDALVALGEAGRAVLGLYHNLVHGIPHGVTLPEGITKENAAMYEYPEPHWDDHVFIGAATAWGEIRRLHHAVQLVMKTKKSLQAEEEWAQADRVKGIFIGKFEPQAKEDIKRYLRNRNKGKTAFEARAKEISEAEVEKAFNEHKTPEARRQWLIDQSKDVDVLFIHSPKGSLIAAEQLDFNVHLFVKPDEQGRATKNVIDVEYSGAVHTLSTRVQLLVTNESSSSRDLVQEGFRPILVKTKSDGTADLESGAQLLADSIRQPKVRQQMAQEQLREASKLTFDVIAARYWETIVNIAVAKRMTEPPKPLGPNDTPTDKPADGGGGATVLASFLGLIFFFGWSFFTGIGYLLVTKGVGVPVHVVWIMSGIGLAAGVIAAWAVWDYGFKPVERKAPQFRPGADQRSLLETRIAADSRGINALPLAAYQVSDQDPGTQGEIVARPLSPRRIDNIIRHDILGTEIDDSIPSHLNKVIMDVGRIPPGHYFRVTQQLRTGGIIIGTKHITPAEAPTGLIIVPRHPDATGISIERVGPNGERSVFPQPTGQAIFQRDQDANFQFVSFDAQPLSRDRRDVTWSPRNTQGNGAVIIPRNLPPGHFLRISQNILENNREVNIGSEYVSTNNLRFLTDAWRIRPLRADVVTYAFQLYDVNGRRVNIPDPIVVQEANFSPETPTLPFRSRRLAPARINNVIRNDNLAALLPAGARWVMLRVGAGTLPQGSDVRYRITFTKPGQAVPEIIDGVVLRPTAGEQYEIPLEVPEGATGIGIRFYRASDGAPVNGAFSEIDVDPLDQRPANPLPRSSRELKQARIPDVEGAPLRNDIFVARLERWTPGTALFARFSPQLQQPGYTYRFAFKRREVINGQNVDFSLGGTTLRSTMGNHWAEAYATPDGATDVELQVFGPNGARIDGRSAELFVEPLDRAPQNPIPLPTFDLMPSRIPNTPQGRLRPDVLSAAIRQWTPGMYLRAQELPVSANASIEYTYRITFSKKIVVGDQEIEVVAGGTTLRSTRGNHFNIPLAVPQGVSGVAIQVFGPNGEEIDASAGKIFFDPQSQIPPNALRLDSADFGPALVLNLRSGQYELREDIWALDIPQGHAGALIRAQRGNDLPGDAKFRITFTNANGDVISAVNLQGVQNLTFAGLRQFIPPEATGMAIRAFTALGGRLHWRGRFFAEFREQPYPNAQGHFSNDLVPARIRNPRTGQLEDRPDVLQGRIPAHPSGTRAVRFTLNDAPPNARKVRITITDVNQQVLLGTGLFDIQNFNEHIVELPAGAHGYAIRFFDAFDRPISGAGSTAFIDAEPFIPDGPRIQLPAYNLNPISGTRLDLVVRDVPAHLLNRNIVLNGLQLPRGHYVRVTIRNRAGGAISSSFISTDDMMRDGLVLRLTEPGSVALQLYGPFYERQVFPDDVFIVPQAPGDNREPNVVFNAMEFSPARVPANGPLRPDIQRAEIPSFLRGRPLALHAFNLPRNHYVRVVFELPNGKKVGTRLLSTNNINNQGLPFVVPHDAVAMSLQLYDDLGREAPITGEVLGTVRTDRAPPLALFPVEDFVPLNEITRHVLGSPLDPQMIHENGYLAVYTPVPRGRFVRFTFTVTGPDGRPKYLATDIIPGRGLDQPYELIIPEGAVSVGAELFDERGEFAGFINTGFFLYTKSADNPIFLTSMNLDPISATAWHTQWGNVSPEQLEFWRMKLRVAQDKYITSYYLMHLGREAAAFELKGWRDAMAAGATLRDVEEAIMASPEAFQYRLGILRTTLTPVVADYYRRYLGREPDAVGLNGFIDALARGASLRQVELTIYFSNEARVKRAERVGNSIQAQIAEAYRAFLGRDASEGEVNNWVRHMAENGLTSDQVIIKIYDSGEGFNRRMERTQPHLEVLLSSYYRGFLGRDPDWTGSYNFVVAMNSGTPPEAVRKAILNSLEANASRIRSYYQTYLGRWPDGPGMNYWVGQLAQGASIKLVAIGIAGSEESRNRPSMDRATRVRARVPAGYRLPSNVEIRLIQKGIINGVETVLRQTTENGGVGYVRGAVDQLDPRTTILAVALVYRETGAPYGSAAQAPIQIMFEGPEDPPLVTYGFADQEEEDPESNESYVGALLTALFGTATISTVSETAPPSSLNPLPKIIPLARLVFQALGIPYPSATNLPENNGYTPEMPKEEEPEVVVDPVTAEVQEEGDEIFVDLAGTVGAAAVAAGTLLFSLKPSLSDEEWDELKRKEKQRREGEEKARRKNLDVVEQLLNPTPQAQVDQAFAAPETEADLLTAVASTAKSPATSRSQTVDDVFAGLPFGASIAIGRATARMIGVRNPSHHDIVHKWAPIGEEAISMALMSLLTAFALFKGWIGVDNLWMLSGWILAMRFWMFFLIHGRMIVGERKTFTVPSGELEFELELDDKEPLYRVDLGNGQAITINAKEKTIVSYHDQLTIDDGQRITEQGALQDIENRYRVVSVDERSGLDGDVTIAIDIYHELGGLNFFRRVFLGLFAGALLGVLPWFLLIQMFNLYFWVATLPFEWIAVGWTLFAFAIACCAIAIFSGHKVFQHTVAFLNQVFGLRDLGLPYAAAVGSSGWRPSYVPEIEGLERRDVPHHLGVSVPGTLDQRALVGQPPAERPDLFDRLVERSQTTTERAAQRNPASRIGTRQTLFHPERPLLDRNDDFLTDPRQVVEQIRLQIEQALPRGWRVGEIRNLEVNDYNVADGRRTWTSSDPYFFEFVRAQFDLLPPPHSNRTPKLAQVTMGRRLGYFLDQISIFPKDENEISAGLTKQVRIYYEAERVQDPSDPYFRYTYGPAALMAVAEGPQESPSAQIRTFEPWSVASQFEAELDHALNEHVFSNLGPYGLELLSRERILPAFFDGEIRVLKSRDNIFGTDFRTAAIAEIPMKLDGQDHLLRCTLELRQKTGSAIKEFRLTLENRTTGNQIRLHFQRSSNDPHTASTSGLDIYLDGKTRSDARYLSTLNSQGAWELAHFLLFYPRTEVQRYVSEAVRQQLHRAQSFLPTDNNAVSVSVDDVGFHIDSENGEVMTSIKKPIVVQGAPAWIVSDVSLGHSSEVPYLIYRARDRRTEPQGEPRRLMVFLDERGRTGLGVVKKDYEVANRRHATVAFVAQVNGVRHVDQSFLDLSANPHELKRLGTAIWTDLRAGRDLHRHQWRNWDLVMGAVHVVSNLPHDLHTNHVIAITELFAHVAPAWLARLQANPRIHAIVDGYIGEENVPWLNDLFAGFVEFSNVLGITFVLTRDINQIPEPIREIVVGINGNAVTRVARKNDPPLEEIDYKTDRPENPLVKAVAPHEATHQLSAALTPEERAAYYEVARRFIDRFTEYAGSHEEELLAEAAIAINDLTEPRGETTYEEGRNGRRRVHWPGDPYTRELLQLAVPQFVQYLAGLFGVQDLLLPTINPNVHTAEYVERMLTEALHLKPNQISLMDEFFEGDKTMRRFRITKPGYRATEIVVFNEVTDEEDLNYLYTFAGVDGGVVTIFYGFQESVVNGEKVEGLIYEIRSANPLFDPTNVFKVKGDRPDQSRLERLGDLLLGSLFVEAPVEITPPTPVAQTPNHMDDHALRTLVQKRSSTAWRVVELPASEYSVAFKSQRLSDAGSSLKEDPNARVRMRLNSETEPAAVVRLTGELIRNALTGFEVRVDSDGHITVRKDGKLVFEGKIEAQKNKEGGWTTEIHQGSQSVPIEFNPGGRLSRVQNAVISDLPLKEQLRTIHDHMIETFQLDQASPAQPQPEPEEASARDDATVAAPAAALVGLAAVGALNQGREAASQKQEATVVGKPSNRNKRGALVGMAFVALLLVAANAVTENIPWMEILISVVALLLVGAGIAGFRWRQIRREDGDLSVRRLTYTPMSHFLPEDFTRHVPDLNRGLRRARRAGREYVLIVDWPGPRWTPDAAQSEGLIAPFGGLDNFLQACMNGQLPAQTQWLRDEFVKAVDQMKLWADKTQEGENALPLSFNPWWHSVFAWAAENRVKVVLETDLEHAENPEALRDEQFRDWLYIQWENARVAGLNKLIEESGLLTPESRAQYNAMTDEMMEKTIQETVRRNQRFVELGIRVMQRPSTEAQLLAGATHLLNDDLARAGQQHGFQVTRGKTALEQKQEGYGGYETVILRYAQGQPMNLLAREKKYLEQILAVALKRLVGEDKERAWPVILSARSAAARWNTEEILRFVAIGNESPAAADDLIVEWLMAHGTDTELKNLLGVPTPFDVFISGTLQEVVLRLLLQQGLLSLIGLWMPHIPLWIRLAIVFVYAVIFAILLHRTVLIGKEFQDPTFRHRLFLFGFAVALGLLVDPGFNPLNPLLPVFWAQTIMYLLIAFGHGGYNPIARANGAIVPFVRQSSDRNRRWTLIGMALGALVMLAANQAPDAAKALSLAPTWPYIVIPAVILAVVLSVALFYFFYLRPRRAAEREFNALKASPDVKLALGTPITEEQLQVAWAKTIGQYEGPETLADVRRRAREVAQKINPPAPGQTAAIATTYDLGTWCGTRFALGATELQRFLGNFVPGRLVGIPPSSFKISENYEPERFHTANSNLNSGIGKQHQIPPDALPLQVNQLLRFISGGWGRIAEIRQGYFSMDAVTGERRYFRILPFYSVGQIVVEEIDQQTAGFPPRPLSQEPLLTDDQLREMAQSLPPFDARSLAKNQLRGSSDYLLEKTNARIKQIEANTIKANEYIQALRGRALKWNDVCEINKILAQGLLVEPLEAGVVRGAYTEDVDFRGSEVWLQDTTGQRYFGYMPASDIPGEFNAIISKLNGLSSQSSLSEVVDIYRRFILSHPFKHMNGKTIKALIDNKLIEIGFPPLPHDMTLTREFFFHPPEVTEMKWRKAYESYQKQGDQWVLPGVVPFGASPMIARWVARLLGRPLNDHEMVHGLAPQVEEYIPFVISASLAIFGFYRGGDWLSILYGLLMGWGFRILFFFLIHNEVIKGVYGVYELSEVKTPEGKEIEIRLNDKVMGRTPKFASPDEMKEFLERHFSRFIENEMGFPNAATRVMLSKASRKWDRDAGTWRAQFPVEGIISKGKASLRDRLFLTGAAGFGLGVIPFLGLLAASSSVYWLILYGHFLPLLLLLGILSIAFLLYIDFPHPKDLPPSRLILSFILSPGMLFMIPVMAHHYFQKRMAHKNTKRFLSGGFKRNDASKFRPYAAAAGTSSANSSVHDLADSFVSLATLDGDLSTEEKTQAAQAINQTLRKARALLRDRHDDIDAELGRAIAQRLKGRSVDPSRAWWAAQEVFSQANNNDDLEDQLANAPESTWPVVALEDSKPQESLALVQATLNALNKNPNLKTVVFAVAPGSHITDELRARTAGAVAQGRALIHVDDKGHFIRPREKKLPVLDLGGLAVISPEDINGYTSIQLIALKGRFAVSAENVPTRIKERLMWSLVEMIDGALKSREASFRSIQHMITAAKAAGDDA